MAYALPLEIDERHIVESFRAGGPAAFESIFRRYSSPLERFCRGRLVNASDVEDAAQETLLKACEAFPRFRRGARLWPWLATIAANVCRDMNRGRLRLVQNPCIGLTDEADSCSADPPEEQVVRKIAVKLRVEIVADALASLPQQYRSHIYLRDYEDWAYEDIGRFYGTSVASVRSTLLRARRKLKERVREVAEERGQWPLPAFIPVGWSRLRTALDKWTLSMHNWAATVGTRLVPSRLIEFLTSAAPAAANTAVATVVALGIIAATFSGSAPTADADSAGTPHNGFFSERLAPADETSELKGTEVSPTDPADQTSGSTASAPAGSSSVPASSDSSAENPAQTAAVGAGNSSVGVSVKPSDENGSDSGGSIETPETSATADPDTSDEDSGASAEKGPTTISCEDPGVVTGAVCSATEAAENATEALPAGPTLP